MISRMFFCSGAIPRAQHPSSNTVGRYKSRQKIFFERIFAFFVVLFAFGCADRSSEPLWQLTLTSRVYADPILEGERFYVFSQAGEAVAGFVKTGKKIWDVRLSGPILGTPTLSDAAILLATQNGNVYSLNKEDGAILWQTHYDDTFIAPLTAFRDQVLVPSETGTLYALSKTDGSETWRVSDQKKFNSGAVLSGNNIWIGSWERQLLSLKPDGSVNWTFKTAEIVTEQPVVWRNMLFVSAYDHYVYALEAQTGKLVWRYAANRPSNLVLWNDQVVFASGKDLIYVSSLTGRATRTIQFGRIISRLYANDTGLYLISGDIYRVNDLHSTTSTFIQAGEPIFKVSFGPGMIIAVDSLYSIYGYARDEEP